MSVWHLVEKNESFHFHGVQRKDEHVVYVHSMHAYIYVCMYVHARNAGENKILNGIGNPMPGVVDRL